MHNPYPIPFEEEQAPPSHAAAVAQGGGVELATFRSPLLVTLDQRLAKRFVRTVVLPMESIITFRDRMHGLLLSELGGYLLAAPQGEAGTKRLSNLIHSPTWGAELSEPSPATQSEQTGVLSPAQASHLGARPEWAGLGAGRPTSRAWAACAGCEAVVEQSRAACHASAPGRSAIAAGVCRRGGTPSPAELCSRICCEPLARMVLCHVAPAGDSLASRARPP